MTDEIKQLQNQISFLEAELEGLQNRVYQLEKKAIKRTKREFNQAGLLEEMKQTFWQSAPHNRTDPFNDWELVLWSAYVLVGTPRQERLSSMKEVATRKSKVTKLVEHFQKVAEDNKLENPEQWARIRTKDYLEYVLLGVTYPDKQGNQKYFNFHIACSDWAINNYSNNIGSWQKLQQLKKIDEPLEDNEKI